MPRKYLPSVDEVAMLTIYVISFHETEETAGYARISRETLRKISLRKRLEVEGFVDKWIIELAELGWSAFPVGDEFGLVRSDIVPGSWCKVTSRPIRRHLDAIQKGDQSLFDELREQFYAPPEFEEDE